MPVMDETGHVISKRPNPGPPVYWVLMAAERREKKMVQTADLSPGKQRKNKQLLLRMKHSYVTSLASTITGFFLKNPQIHMSKAPRLFLC